MKKVIAFIAVALISVNASAQFSPEGFIGSIFNYIGNELTKKVEVKNAGDQIVLGRVVLNKNTDVDSLVLPQCNTGKKGNQPVSRLRFAVRGNDVFVDTIRITYQNNQVQNFNVDNYFEDKDVSNWVNLSGNNDRCIKRIRVTGEVDGGGKNFKSSGPKGSFEITIGSGSKNETRSAITFVGLKKK